MKDFEVDSDGWRAVSRANKVFVSGFEEQTGLASVGGTESYDLQTSAVSRRTAHYCDNRAKMRDKHWKWALGVDWKG